MLALNGMPEHVHLVARLTATVSIANVMKQVKGASSHFVNHELQAEPHFRWQDGYGAFTVCRNDLDAVIAYVKGQKQHHGAGSLWPAWEATFEEVDQEHPSGTAPD